MGSGRGFAQDAAKQAAPQGPQAKDQQEFNMAKGAQDEKDPKKRLDDLDAWKKAYPTTELIDARDGMYLTTYVALNDARHAFDMAHEILKTKPADLTALADSIQEVTAIKPAPTPADLDQGEKDVITILDNPTVFSAAKPPAASDADWAKTTNNVKTFAKKVLLAIYVARDAKKDDKRAVDDLTHLITREPAMATASFELGSAMQRLIVAENRPQDQPAEFWQFARAIGGTGDFALPAQTKTAATDFLTKAYTAFHGSAEGLPDLLNQAKSAPFPSAGFHIDSTVDIATKKAAADDIARANDPLGTLWRDDIKGNVLKDGGDAFFEMNLKGAELPGPDPKDTSDKPAPRYFNATIVSMTPDPGPKEITVGIEKGDIADAKLVFDKALPGKMNVGDKIQFKGTATDLSKSPFMITFHLEGAKEDMNDTWTGKAAPGRGRGAGAGAKGTAPKAAPKQ